MKERNTKTLQRYRLLLQTEKVLEGPMIFLGFVWLILLIIELTDQSNALLEQISMGIWLVFLVDFLLKLFLAPVKWSFIKRNILTAISLVIPALRLFRIFRFIRLLRIFRGTRLIKVIASLNRSMRSLNATMQRRGFGYVLALTLAVILAGAAGMYAFERDTGGPSSYSSALWWTTMLIMTIGVDFWPISIEGRILCILLALYGFAMFGYITAALASFFIGKDTPKKSSSSSLTETEELKLEIRKMQSLLQEIARNQKK